METCEEILKINILVSQRWFIFYDYIAMHVVEDIKNEYSRLI